MNEPLERAGVRIESPLVVEPKRLSIFYSLVLILSILILGFSLYVLIVEFFDFPMPAIIEKVLDQILLYTQQLLSKFTS